MSACAAIFLSLVGFSLKGIDL